MKPTTIITQQIAKIGHHTNPCILHFSELTLEILDRAITKLLVLHMQGMPVVYPGDDLFDMDMIFPEEGGNWELTLWNALLFQNFAQFLLDAQKMTPSPILADYDRVEIIDALTAFLAPPITHLTYFNKL